MLQFFVVEVVQYEKDFTSLNDLERWDKKLLAERSWPKGPPMVPFKTVQNPCRRAVAAGRAARQRVRTALPLNFALDGVALRIYLRESKLSLKK